MALMWKQVNRVVIWTAIAGALLVNLVAGARLHAQLAENNEDSPYARISQLTRVMEQIRQNYVDESKTSYKNLIYGALRGMLSSLDEYSQFLDPDMYKEMKDDTAGEFGGLGIVITLKEGRLTVVSPMEDSPGFHAGLRPGDRILEIDGQPTEGWALSEAVKRLRGAVGTKVKLKIHRPKTDEIREMELTRAKISVPSVKGEKILEEGIAYLRITEFKENTAEALQAAMTRLQTQGMRALILDLRNNPGGLLTSAISVAEKFLKRGDVIVSTQGRDPRAHQVYRSRGRQHYVDLPLAVLINGGSASAAEIVAGALQDHKRAVVIGEKSFGKGSVQSVLPMDDGAAIRFTTAWYFTPNGRRIHEKGIEPDIVVPMKPEDWQRVQSQRTQEELKIEEEGSFAEQVRDIQLERAVDVLKAIMLFQSACNGSYAYARNP